MRRTDTRAQARTSNGPLYAFVYGTLKRGYSNHDRFCRGALYTEDAMVRGRLYELPSGIPVLQVADSDVLAVGTSDTLTDVATQKRFSGSLTAETACDDTCWQMIRGELVVFPDPQLSLPPIDRLEGFRPGLTSLYRRVLVPIMLGDDRWVPAWCYVGDERTILHAAPTRKTCWP